MKPIIEVKRLNKSFKNKKQTKTVLENVNFKVYEGQIFALLGSNGAGKTTIVRILATLLKADCADVSIVGYDLVGQPHKVREQISLTGQYAAVDKMLTGYENMQLVAKLRHLKNYEERIKQLFTLFELNDSAKQQVNTYSGGMVRKLDLAMSLLGNPKIIFLDEPTTGLDPQSRLSLWQIILELKSSGTTIFLTTQYLEEAEYLADYICILDNKKIVASGTPRELKQSFKSLGQTKFDKEIPTLEEVFLSIVKRKDNDE